MPQLISCPDCGRKLRVPDDLLGKRVKCPGCGVKFIGEAENAPEELEELEEAPPRSSGFSSSRGGASARRRPARRDEDDDYEDDRPRRSIRRRRDDDYEEEDEDHPRRRYRDEGDPVQGWQRVRLGLNLIIFGVWAWVAGIVIYITGSLFLWLFGVTTIFSAASSASTSPSSAAGAGAGAFAAVGIGFILVMGIFGLLVLAEQGLRVTGEGFCMGVVPTRRATYLRALAIATFALGAAGVVLGYGACLSGWGNSFLALSGNYSGFGAISLSMFGLSGTAYLAEKYCLLFFLRGTAVSMRKDELARQIVYFMIVVPIFYVLFVVSYIVLACAGGVAVFSSAFSAAGAKSQSQASSAAGNAAGMAVAWIVALVTCWGIGALISLGLFVWYVVLLHRVRGAVSSWLYHRE